MSQAIGSTAMRNQPLPLNEDSKSDRSSTLPPSSPTDLEKPKEQVAGPPQEDDYPPGKVVFVIMAGLFLAAFLVALDRTIIATAIPSITNEFNSLNDVGWYASSYLLTMCAFQLLIGRLYTFYNPKWVFLICISIFELGSLVCGVAPTSVALIVGRSIAGLGSAGIFSGAITLIVRIVPLRKRPAYTGLFGAVFGIASVAGPLLGGVFTTQITWRWCFYINLPIGAVTIVLILLFLHLPQSERRKLTLREKFIQLDPLGTILLMPSIICLLLALQWGGIQYAWSSGRVIAMLVIFGVLFIAFVGVQIWRQETATVPPRIIKNRSVAAGFAYTFCTGGGMMVVVYFLPIWFQAIKNASAVKSGIMNLPSILGIVIGSIIAGFLTRKIGYYTPWMIICTLLTSIGAGLLTTFTTTTNHSAWIGYQVIYGFGLGFGMQQPSVAAQTVLSRKDVSTGASLVFFSQALGGSVFSSIANNVFDNKLAEGLAQLSHLTNIDPSIVASVGATRLREVVPASVLPAVLEQYNHAVVCALYVAVGVSCASVVGLVFMEWKSIKDPNVAGADPPKSPRSEEKPQTPQQDV